ncbi:RNA polymerase sigma factor [Paenibacillus sp. TRM 82003]|nr:RNA polymerase sigma factor [Paenibacillus sp. TRM 82003]
MNESPAFEALVGPHLPDLHRYCRYLAKSRWDAEDLYQESLLKAFVYYRNAPVDRMTKSFLFSAAKLLWIDRYRKEKRRRDPPEAELRSPAADYVEIRSWIEWLAERVPPKHLEMWLLSEYFGYSMQDIADQLDTTVPAVKSTLFRTKRHYLGNRQQRKGRREEAGKAPATRVERWVRAVLREEPRQLTM